MGENIVTILNIVMIILVLVIAVLGITLLFMNKKEKEGKEEKTKKKEEDSKANSYNPGMTREAVRNFMNFDEVKDGMIIRKNKQQYVMVVGCQGVNYDLLSEEEKIAVEEGFVQFLNVLRFPVQLYIQTRSLNLREITEEYKRKIKGIEDELETIRLHLRDASLRGDEKLINDLKYQERRKKNILEYGTDITDYVGRLSLNKNVLQQKTYLIVSYFASELGSVDTYSKEEIDSMCFSELYTRCQSLIRSLATSSVSGKVLSSEELTELLYVAYNRDDEELIQLSKALDMEYDRLYSVGKDVLEKKKEKIEQQIDIEAARLATDSMLEVDQKRKKQKEAIQKEEKVKKKALGLVEQYKGQMDRELYNGTKEEIVKRAEEKKARIAGEKGSKLTDTEIKEMTKRTIKNRKTV